MPVELLLHISSFLTTTEYGELRRSCKHLEASFFSAFGREFFAKRQFMFTEFSLQALVDISRSRYGPFLTYLILSVVRPKLEVPDTIRATSIIAPVDGGKFNKFREECMRNVVLTSSGQDFAMLVQALDNLPNLATVGMRDWSPQTRYREGPKAKWNSYGAATFLRETEVDLQRHSAFFVNGDYPPHVFRTILRALGKTSTAKPERFEVILRQTALPDTAFHIPRYLDSAIIPIVSNLKALFLDLNDWFPGPKSGNTFQCPSVALKDFLSKATSLEHLRLNFKDWEISEGCEQLLQWLSMHPDSFNDPKASSSVMKTPQDPIKFANLSRVDIGHVSIKSEVLLRLYKTYGSTLRSISLHRVTLRRATNEQGNVNRWAGFISMLSVAGLAQLSEISITRPRQDTYGRAGGSSEDITFEGSSPAYEKRWSGNDLEKGLKEIKDAIVFNNPLDGLTGGTYIMN